jgi:xylulose-5-phosphate/fructose-6-phosphate phosphoketolase
MTSVSAPVQGSHPLSAYGPTKKALRLPGFQEYTMHVRGYKKRGDLNPPLELANVNEIDRFSVAMDVINRVPRLQPVGAHVLEHFRNMQVACQNYACEQGIDMPEVAAWR